MPERSKIRIRYAEPVVLEVNPEQVLAGRVVLGRVQKEVTSEVVAERLPHDFREDFENGLLRVFSTDLDTFVVIRVDERDPGEAENVLSTMEE